MRIKFKGQENVRSITIPGDVISVYEFCDRARVYHGMQGDETVGSVTL